VGWGGAINRSQALNHLRYSSLISATATTESDACKFGNGAPLMRRSCEGVERNSVINERQLYALGGSMHAAISADAVCQRVPAILLTK
jgi:hypothetical protein